MLSHRVRDDLGGIVCDGALAGARGQRDPCCTRDKLRGDEIFGSHSIPLGWMDGLTTQFQNYLDSN